MEFPCKGIYPLAMSYVRVARWEHVATWLGGGKSSKVTKGRGSGNRRW